MASTENVDHGKTTLLDSIRGTAYAQKEPGAITQWISASFMPASVIERVCKDLLKKFNIKITIPGLLWIDSPGHEAFVTLRKRGGSVADIAVLVIDINEGFQPQTDESLMFLKQFKTPFLVAATKIDLIPGWRPHKNSSFVESYQKQNSETQDELEKRLYKLVAQFVERGFEADRFDRVRDFKKQVAIVPCSGKYSEGIQELLMMLAGLSQRFLKDKLELSEKARGTVLEVKEVKGLGTTIDVILYDGIVRVGDYLIVGGKKPLVTRIRALLKPPVLKELRIEKKFEYVKEVHAAAGIKISAPGLEDIIAGSPIACVSHESEVEQAKRMIEKEIEEIEFSKDIEGVVVKADAIGSLEALIKMVKENNIPIKKAEVGRVTKQDIVELETLKDPLKKVVLGFNVEVLPDAEQLARNFGIKIFLNNIIYKLIEDYKAWHEEMTRMKREEKLKKLVWPGKIMLLRGFTFRQSKPAIIGVEVLCGRIKHKVMLMRKDGRSVGEISQIQSEGKNVEVAKKGEKVAISLPEVTIGRQVKEGDILYVDMSKNSMREFLTKFRDELTEEEIELIKEIEKIKKGVNITQQSRLRGV